MTLKDIFTFCNCNDDGNAFSWLIIIIITMIAGTALGCVCVLRTPVRFYRFSLATRFYLVPVLARELVVSRSIDILRLAVSSIIVFAVI